MELMKCVADRHGLACLLHEKPFAGVNGSGKHNNWSLGTDTGLNLLEPGNTPSENAQFLLFLVAVIKAVDEYQDLLRVSAASAGNDHRLGANEAPPAIVSIFLGEELSEILEAIESGAAYKDKERMSMEIGVSVLPHFPKDTTDRNRTSPFAFTGNKFEFRMLGSAFSVSGPNIVINTAIAEVLRQFADALEKSSNFNADLASLIKETFRKHKRIVFNGNNYSDEWLAEAERRGLSNLKTTVDALPEFISQKSVELFKTHRVFTEAELHSRYEILMELYCKTIHIEALTMIDIVKDEIIPANVAYQNELVKLIKFKKDSEDSPGEYDPTMEDLLLSKISKLSACLIKKLTELEDVCRDSYDVKKDKDILDCAKFYRDKVFFAMSELRLIVDELEMLISNKFWGLPTYAKMLYSVV